MQRFFPAKYGKRDARRKEECVKFNTKTQHARGVLEVLRKTKSKDDLHSDAVGTTQGIRCPDTSGPKISFALFAVCDCFTQQQSPLLLCV
jgi:hypothetical protein